MCLQEEKLVLQQSFDGKEILLRAADCLLVCFLLSVFKAQRLSCLVTAAVQCRSLFMRSLFLLIINAGCQKTVKPFAPLSLKLLKKNLVCFLLVILHSILQLVDYAQKHLKQLII